MIYLIKFFLTLNLLGFTYCFSEIVLKEAYDTDFYFQVDISKNTIGIDEKLQITLQIKSPEPVKVNKDLLKKNLLNYLGFGPKPFRLLSEESFSEKGRTQKIIYTLDPEIPGTQFLTFGIIQLTKLGSKSNSILKFPTGVFQIDVIEKPNQKEYLGISSPLMNFSLEHPINIDSSNKLAYLESEELKAVEKEKHRQLFLGKKRQYLFLFVIIFIKVATVFYGLWLSLNKSYPNVITRSRIKKPQEKALQKLDEIKTTIQDKDYYSQLSFILREFIEETLGLKLTSMTTKEFFVQAANSNVLDNESKLFIGKILSDCDLAKFSPDNEEIPLAFHQMISDFIKKTP